jgi:hypothetical protein
MISISFSWFMVVYLGLFLAGMLVLWSGYEWLRNRGEKQEARNRLFCRICGSRYRDASAADLLICPVCGSRNERGVKQ